MRSIAYSAIERGVAATAGVDPTSILSHEKVLLAEYITDAVKYCWDYYPWAEFTKTEVRYFRDEFDPSSTYPVGSEVYYDGKYYRNYQEATGGTPLDLVFWYEIGDIDDAPEWTENGCYYIGAKVRYKNKLYLCVSEPTDPIVAYGNQPCCFEVNGITPESSNFIEISIKFDRYISYKQVGKDIIGTCLSITLEDPRYNDTTPLNWREGREGIYIDPYDKTFNQVWVRYRIESPVFTADSADEEVPNFLAQAIKAYAYKHWLVGDGQHEKAQLQDIYGLDLLVRELDKLDSQQDRAAPFTITKEPYRRLNAKQSHKAPITAEQIAAVKKGLAEIAMSVDTDFKGKNAVVKAIIDGDPILDLIVTALNIVRKGYPQIFLRLKPDVRAKNAAQYGEVEVFTKVYTGKAYRSINIGQVKALKLNVVWSPPINGRVNIYSSQVARNCVKQSTIKVMPTRVSCNSVIGYNPVKFRNAYLAAVITAQNVQAKNIVGQGVSVAPVRIDGVFNGRNVVQRGYSTAAIAITDITQGDNIVVKGVATAPVSVVTEILGRNIVQRGQATMPILVTTDAIHNRVRDRIVKTISIVIPKSFAVPRPMVVAAKRERYRMSDSLTMSMQVGGFWNRQGSVALFPTEVSQRLTGSASDNYGVSGGDVLLRDWFADGTRFSVDSPFTYTGDWVQNVSDGTLRSRPVTLMDLRQFVDPDTNYTILTKEEINAKTFERYIQSQPDTTPLSFNTHAYIDSNDWRFRSRPNIRSKANLPIKDAFFVPENKHSIRLWDHYYEEELSTVGYFCWHFSVLSDETIRIVPTLIAHSGKFYNNGTKQIILRDEYLVCVEFIDTHFTFQAQDSNSVYGSSGRSVENTECLLTFRGSRKTDNGFNFSNYPFNGYDIHMQSQSIPKTVGETMGFFKYLPKAFIDAFYYENNYNRSDMPNFLGTDYEVNSPDSVPAYLNSENVVAGEKE